MAYMNQERKAKINQALKPILAKYKVKGSLSVRNHSSICLLYTSPSPRDRQKSRMPSSA